MPGRSSSKIGETYGLMMERVQARPMWASFSRFRLSTLRYGEGTVERWAFRQIGDQVRVEMIRRYIRYKKIKLSSSGEVLY